MLFVRDLLACDLDDGEVFSSMDERLYVDTRIFFGVCASPSIESGWAKPLVLLNEVGFRLLAAEMPALGMNEDPLEDWSLPSGDLPYTKEKPLTTIVAVLSDVPLVDLDDVGSNEVGDTGGISSTGSELDGSGDLRGWNWGFSVTGGRGEMLMSRGPRSSFATMRNTSFCSWSGAICIRR